ncbi:hypothetical protein CDIK_1261 [Cucumispora dikerogammari]|nr:hypothetical protein CDIK_1261 [Cucumispora dikerogammari]
MVNKKRKTHISTIENKLKQKNANKLKSTSVNKLNTKMQKNFSLKPVFIRSVIPIIQNPSLNLTANTKLNKETINRRLELRKLLLGNKKIADFYKIFTVLYKMYLKKIGITLTNELTSSTNTSLINGNVQKKGMILVNENLLKNITKILNFSVTFDLVREMVLFIASDDLISLLMGDDSQKSIEINKNNLPQNIFEEKSDNIFIDKLSEKYNKLLKIIESQTKVEQKVFEKRLCNKKIDFTKRVFTLSEANITSEEKLCKSKTIEDRMNAVLMRLQSKKIQKIESFSENKFITNLRYIFEIEKKSRLSLSFLNTKFQIQNPHNPTFTRETIDKSLENYYLENPNEERKFRSLILFNEVYVEFNDSPSQ